MTRRTLPILAALALTLSIGTANAETAPAAHELDFGKIPNGWTVTRIPDGPPNGLTHIISWHDEGARIMAYSGDAQGMTAKAVADELHAKTLEEGHEATDVAKDKDGNWSFNVILHDGDSTAKALAVVRSFKQDPKNVYVFRAVILTPHDGDALREQARAIIVGAKLK